MTRVVLRGLLMGVFVGLGLGAIVGLVLSRYVDLPAVETLTTYRPIAATQVRARDGTLLGTFAAERRIPLAADQIPAVFRDAVIAVEDASFYQHTGVDPRGILRAAIMNVLNRRWSQGASTITQQLTRSVGILSREKKLVRKVKEMLLAIEIEQRLSKDQIFALYANQVNFGHGNYGVEAASRFFFGKPATRLTLPEAALLAGLPQQPSRLSPLDNPERALGRRNHVLDRMLEEKKIDRAAWEAARQAPLGVAAHFDHVPATAYFVEEVRRAVESQFGSKQMLEGGLTVETTLDPVMQAVANQKVREGLVALQRRQGWPGARRNVLRGDPAELAQWHDESWPFVRWSEGELVYALVMRVEAERAELRIAGREAVLDLEGARWTGRTSLTRLMKQGDVLLVRLGPDAAREFGPLRVTLEPEPRIEGALLALDNRGGAVFAMVGGFDFNRSEWNRSWQSRRQCGSAFKPLVFAAAFERGYSPADTIFDGPILLPDERGEYTYCPLNYYRRYEGIVTLRHALEHSLNASAVKLQQMVTGEAVIDVARRLGVTDRLAPYPTMALGAFELSVRELAAAYAGIANHGQVPTPYFIARVKNAEGKVIFEAKPQIRQALREDVAYLLTHVMEGVVQRGTGAKAAELGAHLAGKTGTTDKFTDAWFIGSHPRVTCAVWVGRDMKQPIGNKMTGAEAALPTWIAFMREWLAAQPEAVRLEEFMPPAGVTMLPVDRATGLRATPACGERAILEAVPEGKEPGECSGHWHDVIGLGWPSQLRFYAYKPGEPPTTAAAIAAAEAKIAGGS
ncbi:MAG TPA: PBP1A family penicillin-binding protein [Thermoanaerobaculaceae bacterium]|nr:PBP1A family penicillin-binding protein [Thermoanaerobaculaceae bacterium]HRS17266.1 PBP1A family penicillin-binding protein [Thermoanaerobaculaceae bacterium]